MRTLQILVLEDDPTDRYLFERSVPEDLAPTFVSSLAELRSAYAAGEFDAVLTDLSVPDTSSPLETAREARLACGCPMIALTGASTPELLRDLMKAGYHSCLVKGQHNGSDVSKTVRAAVALWEASLRQTTLTGARAGNLYPFPIIPEPAGAAIGIDRSAAFWTLLACGILVSLMSVVSWVSYWLFGLPTT